MPGSPWSPRRLSPRAVSTVSAQKVYTAMSRMSLTGAVLIPRCDVPFDVRPDPHGRCAAEQCRNGGGRELLLIARAAAGSGAGTFSRWGDLSAARYEGGGRTASRETDGGTKPAFTITSLPKKGPEGTFAANNAHRQLFCFFFNFVPNSHQLDHESQLFLEEWWCVFPLANNAFDAFLFVYQRDC
ncbi:hypothetical protein BD413DRAFT_4682 [Trametes elegans]|nr:hypothetical protein BD413DRAFT_4682 [Trametes elegans]